MGKRHGDGETSSTMKARKGPQGKSFPRTLAAAGWAVLGTHLLLILLVAHTRLPLGITGDWVWRRTEATGIPWVDIAIVTLAFLLAAFLAHVHDQCLPRRTRLALPLLLVILGLGSWLDYHLLSIGPAGNYESVIAVVDDFTSGYLLEASRIGDARAYFLQFDERLERDEDPGNHLDVHPPGNVAFSWVFWHLNRKGLLPRAAVDWLMPANERRLGREAYSLSISARGIPAEALDTAEVIVVVFWILVAAGRLVTFAAILVLRRGSPRNGGTVAAMLAFGLGGPMLFMGHYDVITYFLGSCCLLVLALAMRRDRRLPAWSGLLGVLLALSTMFSLAFGVLIACSLLVFWVGSGKKAALQRTAAMVGCGLLMVALGEALGLRILRMCLLCARNNSRFFAETGRSGWWAPWNGLDLLLFHGALFVFPALLALPKRCADVLAPWRRRCGPLRAWGWALAPTLVFLLVSPFSRGEVGRLFLFFLPFLALVGCLVVGSARLPSSPRRIWLASALVAAWLTVCIRMNLHLVVFF